MRSGENFATREKKVPLAYWSIEERNWSAKQEEILMVSVEFSSPEYFEDYLFRLRNL